MCIKLNIVDSLRLSFVAQFGLLPGLSLFSVMEMHFEKKLSLIYFSVGNP